MNRLMAIHIMKKKNPCFIQCIKQEVQDLKKPGEKLILTITFRPVQGQTIFDYFRIASLGRRGKGDE